MKRITQKSEKIKRQEYKVREKAVQFALKHGYAEASRRYKYSRQTIHNWAKKYDGTYQSLYPKSRRPKSHPNQHTEEELDLIKKVYGRFKWRGLAHVYVKLQQKGYTRSFTSFKRQLKKYDIANKRKLRKAFSKDKYEKLVGRFPGEYVQIDVKYVPRACMAFESNVKRYYQITAIDLYTRKRVLALVKEHSTYETAKFVASLQKEFGFKIRTIQTDNGAEFVNSAVNSDKKTLFQRALERLNIKHITTRPYSPWQNGVVERSHREDGIRFFNREFESEEQLIKGHKRWNSIYNNTHRQVLNFKTPNQMLEDHIQKLNIK